MFSIVRSVFLSVFYNSKIPNRSEAILELKRKEENDQYLLL